MYSFPPSFLVVARQEFRAELQFMVTDFDCDDEGHILSLKVTVLVLLVDGPTTGSCCHSCAVDLYGKCGACCFQVGIKYRCGQ